MIQSSEALLIVNSPQGIEIPRGRLIDNYSFKEWKIRLQGAIFEKNNKWNFPQDLIPIDLSFMNIKAVFRRIRVEQVHVERSPLGSNKSVERDERWAYVVPPPRASFSNEASNQVDKVASVMEIEPDLVVRAGIVTRALLYHFNDEDPIFLKFSQNSGEGLRLTPRYFVNPQEGTREKMGYGLEYYSEFSDPEEGQRARSLLVHMGLQKANFESIFPLALFFVSGFQKEEEEGQKLTTREIHAKLIPANAGLTL